MPRRDVEFKTIDQVTLRGWLYTPENTQQTPTDISSNIPHDNGAKNLISCLIMTHGWSCVKEMDLPRFAEAFTSALSIAVLIYDHRSFGSSDTKPDCPEREIVPWEQQSDISDAVSYLQVECSDFINPEKIALWGYSFAGGHAITVGASDPRIKAVIACAPVVSGWGQARRIIRPEVLGSTLKAFEEDRKARYTGGNQPIARIPVVSSDPNGIASLAAPEAYAYFSKYDKSNNLSSTWLNDMTLRTSYLPLFHEAQGYIQYISPRPLLMIVMDRDAQAMTDLELEAYEKAREPKELQMLKGGHFDLFGEGNFEKAVEKQIDFLRRWVVDS
ncbi:hypothetical protein CB0940_06004 [Cercospora beticola]|uniref:AB hydrolase-1 domain-containing protein n=1 Tax=Cercospora beticola TaxID=122368 RepID=A0A2G5HX28_CERBT|nr:hypothetical protein CB0940_06004 [Cercospora beticola]PIA97088.1 hypothetical protein CB0940_06004 [Cercospora beticola]WPA98613.1 hypothetical protein RHO25_003225 [Cercospora beticola]